MRFLQLSDIHFVQESDGNYDLNRELRWELLEALRALVDEQPIDAVLVSGDVAFSGQLEEYTRATSFLREVTSVLQIGQDMVFVIPGNHDVDWTITDSAAQRGFRSSLSAIEDHNERDATLAETAGDSEKSHLLTAPLSQYATFAAQYDCPTSAAEPRWDRYLLLTDEVELGIHGLNSVLASHAHDDEDKEPVVVDTGQAMLQPGDGRVHLTMCHHPREWIKGGEQIANRLDKKAVAQITGHTHAYEVLPTAAGLWLRAGALQPSRKEDGWQPHFSLLDLEPVDGELVVRVTPWAWDPDRVEFVLGPEETERRTSPAMSVSGPRQKEIARAWAIRRLTVRLAALSSGDVLNAAVQAGLGPLEGTLDDPPAILAQEATSSAEAVDRLKELWEQLDALRDITTENPFA